MNGPGARRGRFLRPALVVLFAVGGVLAPAEPAKNPVPVLPLVVLVFILSALNGWLMVRLLALGGESRRALRWLVEPFGGAALYLGTAGWSFLAFGVVSLVSATTAGGSLLIGAMAAAFGAGTLAATRGYRAKRSRHEPAT